MKNAWVLVFLLVLMTALTSSCGSATVTSAETDNGKITLPQPQQDSETSIEEALLGRKSVRSFGADAVTLAQLSQLCWAAQGITHGTGRTAPSAGALYPLKVYAVVGDVESLAAGVYLYDPASHSLTRVLEGDLRTTLSQACMGQTSVKQGAVALVITGRYEVITSKYGDRGVMFTHIEAGHAAQNICLQAVGLNLGVVTVGAFTESSVKTALELPEDETPLYVMPAGNY